MNPVQVGDGFVTEAEKKAQVRSDLIEAVMNNQAITDVIAGRYGPIPKFPVIDPNSELGKMWEAARAAND